MKLSPAMLSPARRHGDAMWTTQVRRDLLAVGRGGRPPPNRLWVDSLRYRSAEDIVMTALAALQGRAAPRPRQRLGESNDQG
ncbi:MAG: hypothetical protein ACRDRL_08810 [Sciscionella sp.]